MFEARREFNATEFKLIIKFCRMSHIVNELP